MATAASLSAMDAYGRAKESTARLFGKKEEEGLMGEVNNCCSLTYSQRIYGFVGCFGVGTILSIVAAFFIFDAPKFAVLYSLGNILSLTSTLFLMGPCAQIKSMFAPTRIWATLLYLAMIVITVVVAVLTRNTGLTFLCIFIQYLALTWYALSYIPFARDAAKRCCSSVMG